MTGETYRQLLVSVRDHIAGSEILGPPATQVRVANSSARDPLLYDLTGHRTIMTWPARVAFQCIVPLRSVVIAYLQSGAFATTATNECQNTVLLKARLINAQKEIPFAQSTLGKRTVMYLQRKFTNGNIALTLSLSASASLLLNW